MRRRKCKPNYRRTVLRLPDLDHSKLAFLNSFTSPAWEALRQTLGPTLHLITAGPHPRS